MQVQTTVTVGEARRIIAKGISMLSSVQKALRSGKIFLKGGTTVSCVADKLLGKPPRISVGLVQKESRRLPFISESHST